MSRQLHVGFCARAITQSYRAHTERPQRRATSPAKDLLRAILSPPGFRARAGRRRAFPSAGSGGQNVRVQVAMLGPLEVRDGAGSAREVSGARLRALLVLLALRAGQVVPAGSLIGELWGERLPADAPNALQALVSRLRRALGDPEAVVSGPAGYRLAVRHDDVDVFRFESLAARGSAVLAASPAEAAERRGRAPARGRGEPLPDAAQTEAGRSAVARLTELRLAVTEDLIDAELRLGDAQPGAPAAQRGERVPRLVAALEGLLAASPPRETLAALLMRAPPAAAAGAPAFRVTEKSGGGSATSSAATRPRRSPPWTWSCSARTA